MKRLGLLCVLMVLCALPAYSQFWIDFRWEESHCQNCLWMEQSLRLPPRQAAEYHRLVHQYGKKIEKEARRDSRYWDRAARNIYNYRLERDRKIQYVLTPSQFNLYIRYTRERPALIHDYQGWYNNPHYPHYRPSHDCRHYEEDYWNYRWNGVQHDKHWKDERRDDWRDDRREDRDRHDHGNYRDDQHKYNKGRQPAKPNGRGNSRSSKDKDYNSSRKSS